ncbi:hypothetical protein [Luteolibacter sp. AS25]|uniref:hypothetical protein n=1 Tax=Luteolibacter sp. AS25 TaxID=3135776 RepID=UPI00398AFD75
MSNTLNNSFNDIDEDLATSWVELSKNVRDLSLKVAERSTATDLASDAKTLAVQTMKLCDHVEKIHKDVGNFLHNIESRMAPENPYAVDYSNPEPEKDPAQDEVRNPDNQTDAVNRENIQIQREHHSKSEFKDVVKALFMWKDDPTTRLKKGKDDGDSL